MSEEEEVKEEESRLTVYFNPFAFSIEENNEFIRKGYEPIPIRVPRDA